MLLHLHGLCECHNRITVAHRFNYLGLLLRVLPKLSDEGLIPIPPPALSRFIPSEWACVHGMCHHHAM